MKITINFQKEKLGLYSDEQIKKNFNNPEIVTTSVNPEIVRDGKRKVLMLPFKKGKFGKRDKASWYMKLDKSYEILYCQYKVKFSKNFDWKLGGKLAGLAGGDKPGGGRHSKNGFSSRIMWRENGTMHQYAYYPEDGSHYGRGFWLQNLGSKKMEQLKFKPGKWHTIKMRIQMNQFKWRGNGYITTWLDRKLGQHQEVKLRVKDGGKYGIDTFMFTIFFGGGDKSFAPRRDSKIYFDDIIISDKDIR